MNFVLNDYSRVPFGAPFGVTSSFLPRFLRVGKVKEIPNYFETAFPLMNSRHLLLNAANTPFSNTAVLFCRPQLSILY